MSYEELVKKGCFNKQEINIEQIKALIQASNKNIESAKLLLKSKDYDSSFRLSYDAMLSAGRALSFSYGLRPRVKNSHKNIVNFANKILSENYNNIITKFNKARKRRHYIQYTMPGAISKTETQNNIQNAEEFVNAIQTKIKKEININYNSKDNKKPIYLIIDLEATCWKQRRNDNEIIEIGAVLLNHEYKIIKTFQTFVKPTKNPKLSPFCTKLTSIQQKQVDNAPGFPVALKRFIKQVEKASNRDIKNIIFCSWGYYDKHQFQKDCDLYNIEYPFGKHRSLKHEFAKKKNMKTKGMKQALKISDIKHDGTHHRALDDAQNIAKIFIKEWGNN